MRSTLTISSHAKLFPRLKYLANSQRDTSERNISTVYILSVCVYLISDPLTASKTRASSVTAFESLSSLQRYKNGMRASAEKNTGRSRSHNKLSPPIPIQNFK